MKYNALIPEFIVNDVELSRDFYIDLLGFKVEYERPEDKFVFLSCGEAQLMLEEATPEEKSEMSQPLGIGRTNFSLSVGNVEEIYTRCQNANYPIKSDLEIRQFRVDDTFIQDKEFSILDPDGYFWRVVGE